MIFFIFFFIAKLNAYVPHWQMIRVDPSNVEKGLCDMSIETNQIYKDKCKKYPKEYGGPDECNRLMKPYAGYKCYYEDGPSAVNNALSKVDSSIELLFVENGVPNQKIDFNNLPSQMMVVLDYNPYNSKLLSLPDLMIKTKFDASPAGFQRLFKHMPKESADVQIVGDIKKKVTYLSLTYQTFQIVDSDLNIDNLILDTSTFDEKSPNKIRSKYVLTHISHTLPSNLNANQVGYFNDEKRIENCTITFDSTEIHFNDYTYNSTYYLKYDIDKFTDIILYATKITFSFTEDFLNISDKVIKLNVTLTHFNPSRRPSDDIKSGSWIAKSQLLAKDKLDIFVDGDWTKLTQKPEIIFNYNKDQLDVDETELKKVAKVNETDLYVFQSSWKEKKKKNVGLIVGVTIGCVVAVAIIIVVVILVIRKRKAKNIINDGS